MSLLVTGALGWLAVLVGGWLRRGINDDGDDENEEVELADCESEVVECWFDDGESGAIDPIPAWAWEASAVSPYGECETCGAPADWVEVRDTALGDRCRTCYVTDDDERLVAFLAGGGGDETPPRGELLPTGGTAKVVGTLPPYERPES